MERFLASFLEVLKPESPPTDIHASFFTKLPLEIRNHVYDFAFCEGRTLVRIVQYASWWAEERDRREYSFQNPASFPAQAFTPLPAKRLPPVRKPVPWRPFLNMIVSKQFFAEASAEWAVRKTVDLRWVHSSPRQTLLLPTTMTKVRLRWPDSVEHLATLKQYPTLKTLHLEICQPCMMDLQFPGPMFAFQDKFTDAHFAKIPGLCDITALVQVETLDLSTIRNLYAENDEEAAQWRRNVAALQDYLMREIRRRRANPKASAKEAKLTEFKAWENGVIKPIDYHPADRLLYTPGYLPGQSSRSPWIDTIRPSFPDRIVPKKQHDCRRSDKVMAVIVPISIAVSLMTAVATCLMFARLNATQAE